MSDSKRPGSRDISDLKARLGLKKAGNNPAPAAAPTRSNGVVAPPGLNLPPPPGVQPAQPAQPAIPNAADDPFAAMNAMAAVGTVQRAPEIVIVNDGNPVENVGRKSTAATVAKVAVPAVVALLLGAAIGKIGANASNYNAGLGEAKAILGDRETPSTISFLKRTLSEIDTILDERARNQFRPDAGADKKLAALLKKLEVKAEVFKARQLALDSDTFGDMLKFYAGVAEVRSMLEAHLAIARADDNAFAKAKQKGDKNTLQETDNAPLAGQPRYAVMVETPSADQPGGNFGARIIELGGVYCDKDTKKAPVARCPEGSATSHVAYRTEVNATANIPGELASPSETVGNQKIIGLLPSSIRDQFIRGAEGVASETFYGRRLKTLADLICERDKDGKCKPNGLLELGNRVEQKVEIESKKGSRFSFFM